MLSPHSLFFKLSRIRVGGQDWPGGLLLVIGCGFLVAILHGFKAVAPAFVLISYLTGACLIVGVFFGFLFGIPRSLQGDRVASKEADGSQGAQNQKNNDIDLRYGANTNLEQISDWLTKILVGVGLTQINSLPDLFDRAGMYFGGGLGPSGPSIAVGIIVFFTVSGFLLGYIWTRLYLAGELVRAESSAAELAQQVQHVAEVQEQQVEQQQVDARALSLANRLFSGEDIGKLPIEELKESIAKASPAVRVQVFYLAREARKSGAQGAEHSIPAFKALVDSDPEMKFHRNHAQLGYALKEQQKPDYAAAEAALSKAIGIRGPAERNGYQIYELNRALCRIRQDSNFKSLRPSDPDTRARIREDITVAREVFPDLAADAEFAEWLRLNPQE